MQLPRRAEPHRCTLGRPTFEMPSLTPVDVCRVCRVEAEEDNPMVHPCKCSGSVKFVHADWYVPAQSPPGTTRDTEVADHVVV